MSKHTTQIAIIGGGICGLWLLNILRQKGYDAWLFEKDSLGGVQTLASQGMIHGGLKYALGGFTTPSSESIAQMPEVWRSCLAGSGPIDLSGLDVLSDDYYLFSDNALSSKVTAFFASKSLQGRISVLDRADYPGVFQAEKFKGKLYRLEDLVLDTPQLVKKLSDKYQGYIFQGAPEVLTDGSAITGLDFPGTNQTIVADRYILTAGAGNEALISGLPRQTISMQQRPLQQVMVRGDLPKLYAHAVSLASANKPRVTFTSHAVNDNKTVWYLGGNLAEQGVGVPADKLIDMARKELNLLLPWIDLEDTQWATLNIDRAEPAQAMKNKPDFPFVKSVANYTVCWPTKLTLTPMLGDEVLQQLPIQPNNSQSALPQLPPPLQARTPWEIAFD
ncbi:MAG: FAD-dependent oxidoreductase [bacterium]|nr:FAD-dependent oxidoreductase [Gammaproteobacteria bacterium]HIL94765.1 FAD-dependent oxidoreductase [Pseudomonadales bacterium]